MTKILSCAAVIGLLVASSSAFAGGRGLGGTPGVGASSFSPGHQFQSANGAAGPAGGPGASGYAPGRVYIENRATAGTGTHSGASVYAPGFLK